MTPQELEQSRVIFGLNIKQMAAALNTPYRTYQNWELGQRRIPGIVNAIISLMEEKMETIKIYKIEVTKGFYVDESGVGFSLTPWGDNTVTYEGSDDGGQNYILPAGFEVAESQSGTMEIYDNKGQHCRLDKNKYYQPMIVCSDGQILWLKKATTKK